jgi:hypothetical protein
VTNRDKAAALAASASKARVRVKASQVTSRGKVGAVVACASKARVRAKAKVKDRVKSIAKGKRPKEKPRPPHLRSNNKELFNQRPR